MKNLLLFTIVLFLLSSCGNTQEEETEERVIPFSCFAKTDSINGKSLENTEPLLYINYSGKIDGFTAKSVSTLEYDFRDGEEDIPILPTLLYLDNGTHHYKVEISDLHAVPENVISILKELKSNYFTNFYSDPRRRIEPTDSLLTLPLRSIQKYGGKVDLQDGENLPFFLLDVNFDGHPALVVNKGKPYSYSISYDFDIYGLGKDNTAKLIEMEPFNNFSSKVGDWTEGSGTIIDYNNKEIKIVRIAPGSDAEVGAVINDTYKLDPSSRTFKKNRIVNEYDYGY